MNKQRERKNMVTMVIKRPYSLITQIDPNIRKTYRNGTTTPGFYNEKGEVSMTHLYEQYCLMLEILFEPEEQENV